MGRAGWTARALVAGTAAAMLMACGAADGEYTSGDAVEDLTGIPNIGDVVDGASDDVEATAQQTATRFYAGLEDYLREEWKYMGAEGQDYLCSLVLTKPDEFYESQLVLADDLIGIQEPAEKRALSDAGIERGQIADYYMEFFQGRC